jgi:hypothetical protein
MTRPDAPGNPAPDVSGCRLNLHEILSRTVEKRASNKVRRNDRASVKRLPQRLTIDSSHRQMCRLCTLDRAASVAQIPQADDPTPMRSMKASMKSRSGIVGAIGVVPQRDGRCSSVIHAEPQRDSPRIDATRRSPRIGSARVSAPHGAACCRQPGGDLAHDLAEPFIARSPAWPTSRAAQMGRVRTRARWRHRRPRPFRGLPGM